MYLYQFRYDFVLLLVEVHGDKMSVQGRPGSIKLLLEAPALPIGLYFVVAAQIDESPLIIIAAEQEIRPADGIDILRGRNTFLIVPSVPYLFSYLSSLRSP